MSQQSGLGQAFLGLIILPIAGNACEHITAVFVACKNKMDLAIGVALGSSIQVHQRMPAVCALQVARWLCALASRAHTGTCLCETGFAASASLHVQRP